MRVKAAFWNKNPECSLLEEILMQKKLEKFFFFFIPNDVFLDSILFCFEN